jgi:hypothetical protein
MAAPSRRPTCPCALLERYVGTYERPGVRHQVAIDERELVLHTELRGPVAELRQGGPPPPARLRPIDAEHLATSLYGESGTVGFLDFVRGQPWLLLCRLYFRCGTCCSSDTVPPHSLNWSIATTDRHAPVAQVARSV